MIHNCLPPPTCIPLWDPELDCLREQLRRARAEEEKRRIRQELDRLRWPPPAVTWTYITPCPAPRVISIQDVLRRIPAR